MGPDPGVPDGGRFTAAGGQSHRHVTENILLCWVLGSSLGNGRLPPQTRPAPPHLRARGCRRSQGELGVIMGCIGLIRATVLSCPHRETQTHKAELENSLQIHRVPSERKLFIPMCILHHPVLISLFFYYYYYYFFFIFLKDSAH